jgi:DNA-binding MarR family transcriptional regulator
MPAPRRTQTQAAEALAAVAPLATRWIERLLARHDPPLTVTQYLALRAIARKGISGTELARRAGVSGPAVSQLLAGLDQTGLINRHASDDDRRRHALDLSPAGERTFHSAQALLRNQLASLLTDLPHPEADALARLPAAPANAERRRLARAHEHEPRPVQVFSARLEASHLPAEHPFQRSRDNVSKTGTVRMKTFFFSRCSSHCVTAMGARMQIAAAPSRADLFSARNARKPAT